MNVHKIVWQEGMLLRPQHLQHNDRYYDNQMKARTQLLGSYNWGFLALELDRQFLNMGKLVISQASGVLPDGSLFELGGNTEPLALDVPPNTSNVPIYLALPLVTGNHIEARRPEQAEVLARYTAYDLEVADSNAGEDSMVQVSCARPDFRLLLGEQQSDQAYVKLKVAVVLDTTPDGVISLDPDFVPSYLHAHASAYLLSCLKEVISMLGHRGDTIAERIRSNGKVGGAEVGDFMMLQLINRTELLLRHYLGLEQVHPEQLYRVLLTMLGDLATFGSEQASAPGQPLPAQRPGRQLPQADGGDSPGPVDGARAACHRTASPGPPVRHPGLAPARPQAARQRLVRARRQCQLRVGGTAPAPARASQGGCGRAHSPVGQPAPAGDPGQAAAGGAAADPVPLQQDLFHSRTQRRGYDPAGALRRFRVPRIRRVLRA